jgi:ParB family transcriptional regulator, chromosome partitioning protein
MNNGLMLDVNVNSIKFSKNYRQTFPENSLKELARSIGQHGIVQPLVVRRRGDGFELIAGDRRLKAAEIAGLITVPARIVEATDSEVLEIQLVENVQREAVPYYEEALALKRLQDDPYNYDVHEIAKKIGKSEQYVYFQLKLTRMCLEARRACEKGELSKSVAWLLSRVENEDVQANAARALRRENKSKLVGERAARQYLEDLKNGKFTDRGIAHQGISANGKPKKPPKKFYTPDMSDYLMNWKKYLVDFTPDQFLEWKAEVAGKTDTLVWARAVDIVMTRYESGAGKQ